MPKQDEVKADQESGEQIGLEALLARADRTAIEKLLLERALWDTQFEAQIRLTLSDARDANFLSDAKLLIRESIRAVAQGGFVRYRDASAATQGAWDVVGRADSVEDATAAASLCLLAMEEMLKLTGYCDDSGGEISTVLYDALPALDRAVGRARAEDAAPLFKLMYAGAMKRAYDGWDEYRYAILEQCARVCARPADRKKLTQFIEDDISGANADKYSRACAECVMYRILRTCDGEAAAEEYLLAHLHNASLRETAVEAALARENYARAIELCLDADNSAELPHWSAAHQWQTYRYTAMEGMGDIEGMKALAEELLRQGRTEYLDKLRALHGEDWPQARDALVQTLESGAGPAYEKLIVEEALHERMLRYALQDPQRLPNLYPHLPQDMRADIEAPFAAFIRKEAGRVSDRNGYKGLFRLLKKFADACGFGAADALRAELIAAYPRRPSLREELSKKLRAKGE